MIKNLTFIRFFRTVFEEDWVGAELNSSERHVPVLLSEEIYTLWSLYHMTEIIFNKNKK